MFFLGLLLNKLSNDTVQSMMYSVQGEDQLWGTNWVQILALPLTS